MRRFISLAAICLLAAIVFAIPASAQSCVTSATMAALVPPVSGPTPSWSFRLAGFGTSLNGRTSGPLYFVGSVGTFKLRLGTDPRAPQVGAQGFVDSLISINLDGTMYTTLMPVTGKFQLDWGPNGDCTSGTMTLASGTNPSTVRSVRFVLHAGNTRMYLVSTDNDGVILSGDAERQQ